MKERYVRESEKETMEDSHEKFSHNTKRGLAYSY